MEFETENVRSFAFQTQVKEFHGVVYLMSKGGKKQKEIMLSLIFIKDTIIFFKFLI